MDIQMDSLNRQAAHETQHPTKALAEPQLTHQPDDYFAWPNWARLAPALLLISNWALLLWLASHLDSVFAQLVVLPLCMVGVALAWGWHRD